MINQNRILKRQVLTEWTKKHYTTICCLQEIHFNVTIQEGLKTKQQQNNSMPTFTKGKQK